jgi:hypothetical protein
MLKTGEGRAQAHCGPISLPGCRAPEDPPRSRGHGIRFEEGLCLRLSHKVFQLSNITPKPLSGFALLDLRFAIS